jgi:hypothetical protein
MLVFFSITNLVSSFKKKQPIGEVSAHGQRSLGFTSGLSLFLVSLPCPD